MAHAKLQTELAINKYNNLRIHASCEFQTPQNTHVLENIVSKTKIIIPTVAV